MFIQGESSHQLDEKARIFIPRRFQVFFDMGGFLTRALNGKSLVYFPTEEWTKYREQWMTFIDRLDVKDIGNFLPAKLVEEKLLRHFSCGQPVTLDTSGRLTIPPALRKRAKLADEVTLIAMGDRMEIWDTATWEDYDEQEMTPAAMVQALRELGNTATCEG